MKTVSNTIKLLGGLTLLLTITSCSKEDSTVEAELAGVSAKAQMNTVGEQLDRLTQKMQRYHNFQVSEAQGFMAVSPFIPNMGIHYGKMDRFDGTFELEKPEILLYVPGENGAMNFVGVEYAVPVKFSPKPPEGFIGTDDHWEYNPFVAPDLGGSWTLHAWVILDNPNGVFAPQNPQVPASDPSGN